MSLLAALLSLVGIAPARTTPPLPFVGSQDASPQSRQILVMLRLSPDHLRGKPGYGGSYGGLARAVRRDRASTIARRYGLTMIDGWAMPLLGLDCYVMRVPEGVTVEAAIAKLSTAPDVLWSEPMRVYRTQGSRSTRADPLFAAQPASLEWHLADLHRHSTGHGVTIAVVDSRIEVNHPDLSGQFVANEDFVIKGPQGSEAHGTGVAGVIAAKEGNGIGIAGIASGAKLLALRACWQTAANDAAPTLCDSLSLARAIHFAIERHAQVINLSLSGPQDRLLEQLLSLAAARHISVVAAFDPGLPKGGFPASLPGVIAVAEKSLVPRPAFVYGAPGRDVPTTQPGGRWYLVNGSSYAAAHVSGLIALVRQFDRKAAIVATNGIVDACASVERAAKSCVCACSGKSRDWAPR